ncbi:hypothetical protein [Jatrophihabitans fulvus]
MRTDTAGALWAAAYVPVHAYWALGGATAPFGIADPPPEWVLANGAACVLIAGAGLLSLALGRSWGRVVPARRGIGFAGGALALAHWALFSVLVVVDGPDLFGWWNLLVFEPWFGVMGAVLLVLARRVGPQRASSRSGATVLLLGVAVTVVGVIAFSPWLFLLAGPVLTAGGAAASYLRTTRDDAVDRRGGRSLRAGVGA